MLAALLVLDDLGTDLAEDDGDDAITLVDGATLDLDTRVPEESLELRAVDRALARIDEGTFGACDRCAGPIELPRLSRVPWSRCCAECVAFSERELRGITEDSGACAECEADRQLRHAA